MKYAILKVINGNYFVHAEGITDLSSAKTQFHGLCQVLWNAPDVTSAYVMIADEQLDAVEGYKEYIHHDPVQPTPKPEPEPEPEPEHSPSPSPDEGGENEPEGDDEPEGGDEEPEPQTEPEPKEEEPVEEQEEEPEVEPGEGE